MGAVLGQLLPLAVGVAVSPVPIIATILMLLSDRARTTSVGFAGGWLVGIVVATVVFVLLGGVVTDSQDDPSTSRATIEIVLGVLLLVVGLRQWRNRRAEHDTPAWMKTIDHMTVAKSAGLGFALAAINPKNLIMCAAAGVAIGGADLTSGGTVVSIAVFAILAASTVVLPVLGYLLAADRLRGPLDKLESWLRAHNTAVMSVLVLVIGVTLIGKGVGALG